MAAKNKSKRLAVKASETPDPNEVLALQLRASKRHDELMEELRELKAKGKRKKAKMIQREAETIEQWLIALESEIPSQAAKTKWIR